MTAAAQMVARRMATRYDDDDDDDHDTFLASHSVVRVRVVRHPSVVLRMTDYRARKSGSNLAGYRSHLAYINRDGRKGGREEGC